MRYEAPDSAERAAQLLAAEAGIARVLAGGTDLLVQMRTDVIEPDLVVDIKKIAELRTIKEEAGGLRIGRGRDRRGAERACQTESDLAGHRRSREPDRLDADPGPRHARRQPVQCLARRRQRASAHRRRRQGRDRRPERPARNPGRGRRHGRAQAVARQGRVRHLVPAAAEGRARAATPTCASSRARKWTSRSSAAASR